MARNDGVDRTVERNRDLKTSSNIQGAEAHNERKKDSYSNPDRRMRFLNPKKHPLAILPFPRLPDVHNGVSPPADT